MPLLSITRFRARAFSFVPMFMHHAQRSISQIRSAKGRISLALLKDTTHVFRTTTLCKDVCSMMAYPTIGSHREAMPW